MNVLFTCQREGLWSKRMEKQGPLFWWSWCRAEATVAASRRAAVNKASAELKNGNEFLIGDTLYLSSWQRSDCTAAFLVLSLCAFYFPLGAPAWYPPVCWGPSRVKKEEKHNNRASSWMITLNYSLSSRKVLDKSTPLSALFVTKAPLCRSIQSCTFKAERKDKSLSGLLIRRDKSPAAGAEKLLASVQYLDGSVWPRLSYTRPSYTQREHSIMTL